MKRGTTDAETCALNGWTVGTVLRGFEPWDWGGGNWRSIRITAIGEEYVLAVDVAYSQVELDGRVSNIGAYESEGIWALDDREWTAIPPPPAEVDWRPTGASDSTPWAHGKPRPGQRVDFRSSPPAASQDGETG